MMNKTQFKGTFLARAYLKVWAESKKWGEIVTEKTIIVARGTPAQKCLYFVNALHHGMQLQFEFINGELKTCRMAPQNNLF